MWAAKTPLPLLTSIIQKRRLMLFGHLIRMDESADARRILTAVPQSDWRRPVGRPHSSWMATLKNDLYLCTTSPMRMLSEWPWISRCGDYWQQAELRTDGACRITMMMMCACWRSAHHVGSEEVWGGLVVSDDVHSAKSSLVDAVADARRLLDAVELGAQPSQQIRHHVSVTVDETRHH